jgi:iron complex transport system substrate-binding protein
MRVQKAPPSSRSEGSFHVRGRALTLLVAIFLVAGCQSGGAFLTQPPTHATPTPAATTAPTTAATAAATAAPTTAPTTAPTAPPSASASAAATAAPTASPAPTPSPSAPPSASPSIAAVTYPLTLTDDENNTVTLKAQPQRIVSLTPATTEIVYALGAGDHLIANDDADDYPADVTKLPHVATFNSVDVEKIVGMNADLVIAGGNGFNKPDALTQLRNLKVPVLVVYAQDVDGVFADIGLIGQALGAPADAAALVASMRAQFQVVEDATASLPHPRTFYELDATKEIYGPADKSFVAQMVEFAGGTPITTGSTTVFSIPLEKLVAADPEVIVLGDAAFGTTPDIVKKRPGWETMTAVKADAVRPVDDTLISRPGPRLADGLRNLALAIHPDLVLPPLASASPAPSASAGGSPVASASPAASGSAAPSSS